MLNASDSKQVRLRVAQAFHHSFREGGWGSKNVINCITLSMVFINKIFIDALIVNIWKGA